MNKTAIKELYWRKSFHLGVLEKKTLEYFKKFKRCTPGEIMMFLNSDIKLSLYSQPTKSEIQTFLNTKKPSLIVNYAKATRIIDTLYAFGYVDQSAFYWERGKIKLTVNNLI